MSTIFLKVPPKYVQSSIAISFAGMLFGLETGSIGALTVMPQFKTSFGFISSTLHGLVVSTILLPAAFSSFFGGHLANSIGRIKAIALGTAIFGLGAAIEASSVKLGMLIGGRAIKGIGEGLFLSTSVVYITEISPPRSRGTLASIPQLLVTIGVVVGFFTCYGSVRLPGSISWRLPLTLQASVALSVTIFSLLLCPESPRWLTAVGRHREALSIWEKLDIDAAEREKIEETEGGVPEPVRFRDILSVFKKDVWRQTSLGVFLMGMQQASGIDGVLYYAPLLFTSAGFSTSTASFLASGISALLIFLITIPAFLLMDRYNRTTSAIVGGVLITTCMFIIGSLYASNSVHASSGVGRWIVVACIYLFALSFSATWGVGFRVYISEIQTKKTRAGGSSLALSANWVINWIIAFSTPIFLARSTYGVYFFFGGATLLTVVVCVLFMPETRGKSLEEIEEGFRTRKWGKGRERYETELGTLVIVGETEGSINNANGRREGREKNECHVAVSSGSESMA